MAADVSVFSGRVAFLQRSRYFRCFVRGSRIKKDNPGSARLTVLWFGRLVSIVTSWNQTIFLRTSYAVGNEWILPVVISGKCLSSDTEHCYNHSIWMLSTMICYAGGLILLRFSILRMSFQVQAVASSSRCYAASLVVSL